MQSERHKITQEIETQTPDFTFITDNRYTVSISYFSILDVTTVVHSWLLDAQQVLMVSQTKFLANSLGQTPSSTKI